ncbi:MAG: ester cyclase [Gammaproteobacteria bacterium]|nr:ester cyclase [Gammaproteobacteria bacterium]MCP5459500.1 ester cyclase [Gammaproteobacteria bacterium]
MSETNKVLARRSFEAIWNRRDLDCIDELYAPGYIGHIAARADAIQGPKGLKQFTAMFQFAFPDIRFVIEEQIAEGNSVATRWTVQGTQQSDFMGMAPSGEALTLAGISIQHFSNNQIVESWDNWDALGMLQGATSDLFELLSMGV